MNNRQFKKLAADRGVMYDTPTYEACRLVLVEGLSANAAAKMAGLGHASSVTRPLARLTSALPVCSSCGQKIINKPKGKAGNA